ARRAPGRSRRLVPAQRPAAWHPRKSSGAFHRPPRKTTLRSTGCGRAKCRGPSRRVASSACQLLMATAGSCRCALLGAQTRRLFALARDPGEEIEQPILPRAAFGDGAQAVVIVAASRLEECAQMEQRQRQRATLHEQQGDEETSHAPVAVEEWVDRLALVMHQ